MIVTQSQIGYLLEGALVAMQVALLAAALGLVLSFIFGFGRLSRWRAVNAIATTYVEVFRGTSAFVQLYVFFYILPFFGIELEAFVTGVIALGLNIGAYGTEAVRAAILGVHKGQREAADAIGLTGVQAMRFVILPQAIPVMLPTFGNFLIWIIQGTSLLSLITVNELTFRSRQLINAQGASGQTYLIVAVMYFVMCYPLSRLVRKLERSPDHGAST